MNTIQEVINAYGENWESDADRLHEVLHSHTSDIEEKDTTYDKMEALHDYIDDYAESYKRFREANKPKEDAVDYGI